MEKKTGTYQVEVVDLHVPTISRPQHAAAMHGTGFWLVLKFFTARAWALAKNWNIFLTFADQFSLQVLTLVLKLLRLHFSFLVIFSQIFILPLCFHELALEINNLAVKLKVNVK